jgi:hypothetical protein
MADMKKIAAVLLLFAMSSGCLLAQQAPLDTVVRKFSQYRESNLQEKIYAHLDQAFYLTGETLWFKLYDVDGSFHKPLGVSSVAYAELLDRGNFPVLQAKIEMKNGFGDGSFFLPASLSSGNYKFRVYTNWMKNFDPEFFFRKEITIVNPFVVPEAVPPSGGHGYTVDFFPEGGHLVNGIRSQVGYKVTDATGRGAACRGFILDSRRDTIASFSPTKFGMGDFSITPQGQETYKAVVVRPDGVRTIHDFPAVESAGYVMQVTDSSEYLVVKVRTSGVSDSQVLLFAHARHITEHAATGSLKNNKASFLVRKSDLAEGISHLTVFNERLFPVCERLYFIQPHKDLTISVQGNQDVYSARQKVSLVLQTMKNGGPPTPANLSVSVYKSDSLGSRPANINHYLWLTSDLTGRIESPEYYFSAPTPEVLSGINDLMLTQGWRRFDWKDVLEGQNHLAFLPEVNGHIITGTVTKDHQPQRGIFTYLGSPGKIVRAYGSWSNNEGGVRFEIKDFYGPRKIILMTQTDSTQTFLVQINNPFSTVLDKIKLMPFTPDAKIKGALTDRSIAMQVQDIYYYDTYGSRFSKPTVDSMAFYGKADATYYLDDYTRFPIMEEVMREYVPGVFVRKRRDGFHFIVVDIQNKGVLAGDPMILLDGVPVQDTDDIMKVDPLTVKKLEVIQRQYYLGQAVFSGIVSYTTYKGDLGNLELDPKSLSLNYEGLQLRREFHSPEYRYQDRKDRMPDQRYLLYWNANVATDAEGKQRLDFYTSDVGGRYEVVVQGMDSDGFSGSATYFFTVNVLDNQ